MEPPPPLERLPAYPASWYLFGEAHLLRRGPVSHDLLGRRLVAYRTAAGRIVVLDARCSHLGADLGLGSVRQASIRCPFHGWEYAPDGICTRLPGGGAAPPFARQTSYPVAERHGLIFFFNGLAPLFPLPFFEGCRPEDFVAARPLRFLAQCPWYMPTSNSFDAQHFQAGHDRRPLGPPEVDCPAPFARRMRLRAAVVGHSIFDRLLRRCAGETVDISMTNWGGAVVVVTGTFPRTCSYLMTMVQPIDAETSVLEVIVFARRRRNRLIAALVEPVSLWLRRLFTWGFMNEEFDRLAGIRYNAAGLIDKDRTMIDFFNWIAQLPQTVDPPSSQGTGAASPAT